MTARLGPRLAVMPPLPPAAWLRPPLAHRAWPLDDSRCRLVAWGRHGIYRGVMELGLRPGDEVLAPAWHHGSEIEALVRSGLRVRFYDNARAAQPAPEELPVSTETRAVHLTHVLGFPAPADRWRRFCDEHGLLLIEDAAQAWMAGCAGRPAGAWGDLAVFCLYKMVGLPEGAVFMARTTSPMAGPPIDPRFGLREHGLMSAAWVLARSASLHAVALKLRGRRRRGYDHDADIALRDPSAGPWRPTRFLLDRLADPHIAELRREHYARLLTRLRPLVPAPFDELPADACPFALPIEIADKAAVLQGLQARGVLALDFWSLPHPALESAKHPHAARRRARTIALPVHQELRARDVDHIADVVEHVVAVAHGIRARCLNVGLAATGDPSDRTPRPTR